VSLSADGSFTYTPAAGFHGSDLFRYRVTDGQLSSQDVIVTIEVIEATNRAPVPAPDEYSIAEDGILSIAADLGLLANDTDPDGETLVVTVESQPSHGTLTIQSDGSFTYTPAGDFNGFDQFRYRVSDGTVTSDPVSVTIRVTPQNDAPIAITDQYGVNEDGSLNVPIATGLLANDHDIDDDSLTAVVVTPPRHGALTLNPDGSLTYTPNSNFFGLDEFIYRASDGQSSSADMTVTINVIAQDENVQGCTTILPEPEAGSGNVRAKVKRGLLSIQGDGTANAVRIQAQRNGNMLVTGLKGTLVNGKTGSVQFRSVRSVDIGMGSGNDNVHIEPDAELVDAVLDRGLTIRMDAGDDRLALCGLAISGAVRIGAGLGSDTYLIDDSDLQRPANIGSGNAPDIILVETQGDESGPPTYFREDSNIRGKRGRDRIKLGKNERNKSVKLRGPTKVDRNGD
jgi:VCBS repeat-containing protein